MGKVVISQTTSEVQGDLVRTVTATLCHLVLVVIDNRNQLDATQWTVFPDGARKDGRQLRV